MKGLFGIYIGLTLLMPVILVQTAIETHAQAIEEWVSRYDGPTSGADEAQDIAVDADGNVYVTGWSDGLEVGTNYDYATVKYNSDGVEQWVARYNGPGDGYDEAIAISVDPWGNAVVTGQSWSGIPMRDDVTTIKYDDAGVEQWVARYDASYNSDDWAVDLAIDANGNVYVAGENGYHLFIIKYNSAGVEQWVAIYEAPNFGPETATALAVDEDGNVYVTGHQPQSIGGNYDYLTIKYNSSGIEQWTASYNGLGDGHDYAHDIAVDADGNVYVTGESLGYGPWRDYTTVKYSPEGIQLWEARYNGPGNGIDLANSIAVESGGNVYVTGYTITRLANYDYATIKYNSDGMEQWVALYDGPGDLQDEACSLVLDMDGNIYVTGYSCGAGSSRDYATVKYSPEGEQLWVKRYNGPLYDYDEASSIAVDQDANVYVTGWSGGIGTGYDYATVKYSQVGSFSIALTPAIQPILIPRSGGSFDYNIEIINLTDSTLICDLWCDVLLPDSSIYGPLWGPVDLNLRPGFAGNRDRIQSVPPLAPAGYYSYHCYLGLYPSIVWDQDWFSFVKLSTGDGESESEWANTGESFKEWISSRDKTAMPESQLLDKNYPNPFNPLTTIRFSLPEASHVKLTIYDLLGRQVAVLVNDWQDAGAHELTFNGSDLTSGIYLYHLTTVDFTATGKMVLMK